MSNAAVSLVPGLNHRSPRQYACRHCEKVFKRSEHCSRHERSHTRERPFSCRYCGRSYARKDLVRRHERTLHADHFDQVDDASSIARLRGQADGSLQQPTSPQNGTPSVQVIESASVSPQDRRTSYAPSPSPTGDIFVETHAGEVVMGDVEPNGQMSSLSHPLPTPTSVQVQTQPYPEIEQDFNMYYSGSPLVMQFDTEKPQELQTSTDSNEQPATSCQHLVHQGSQNNLSSGTYPQTGQDREWDPPEMFPNIPFLDLMPMLDQSLEPVPDPSNLDNPSWLEFPSISRVNFEITGRSNGITSQLPFPSLQNANSAQPTPQHTGSDPKSTKHLLFIPENPRFSHPRPVVCDKTYASICKNLSQYLLIQDTRDEMPSAKFCQSFLASYMNSFQHHFPILHLPSLCLHTTPSPLILAVCSIGAVYRLDQTRARRLHDMATRAIISTPIPMSCDALDTNEEFPLWLVQTKLLLMYYGMLSGEKGLLSSFVADCGFFILVYEKKRISLQQENNHDPYITWKDWINQESWKRVLAGIYVVSALHVVIYVTNPGFNAARDLEIELLADEDLWNAASAEAWRELQSGGTRKKGQTIRAILADIISQNGCPQTSPYKITPFSALFVMHAVVVHIWQLFQAAQTFAQDPSTPDSSCDLLCSSITKRALESLRRCQELLKHSQEQENYVDDDANVSLVFDCHAVLRIAYTRLFSTAIQFESLCTSLPQWLDIEVSFSTFAATKLERTPYLLEAVEICLEGFRISTQPGLLLVRKKAAFAWTIEHAIAAWLSSLLLTKWVHSIEIDTLCDTMPTPEESQLLESIKSTMKEVEYDFNTSKSLAAGLARTWSICIYDVWVWGILPRMGALLDRLATAYELDNQAHRH